MARASKLKVYRTAIGFHDAYVAAASQKAALAAWGSSSNLFAGGMAELVEDPALTQAPLEQPGTVIRRLRGTPAEQLAALPPDVMKLARPAQPASATSGPTKQRPVRKAARAPAAAPKPKAHPKPDRTVLEAARKALEAAESAYRRERAAFADREAALAKERHRMENARSAQIERCREDAERAEADYDRAMRLWAG